MCCNLLKYTFYSILFYLYGAKVPKLKLFNSFFVIAKFLKKLCASAVLETALALQLQCCQRQSSVNISAVGDSAESIS
jgi:hypothetical protein